MQKNHWSIIFLVLLILELWICFGIYRCVFVYHEPNYVCKQMSRDIEDQLEQVGIPVVIMKGTAAESAHMWIKIFGIEFDSVTLFPFPNSLVYHDAVVEYHDYAVYENTNVW